MTTSLAARVVAPPTPAHLALAGFAVAGVILVVLDLQSPAAVVSETLSSHAASAAHVAFALAMLASCAGVGAALVRAWRAMVTRRVADLMLLALWPVGIGIASIVDQDEHSWTGMVHNVAVGAAIVGVHLAAARSGRRLLTGTAVGGFAVMAVLLAFIVAHTMGGFDMPVGVAERVLIAMSAVVAIGALRQRRPAVPA